MWISISSVKMRNVLVLLLYLTGPIAGTTKFLENVPPNPWFFTTPIQRLRPMRITKFPRFFTKDLPKLILWKHLLEMECIKDICSELRDKERPGRRRPFEVTGHGQVPTLRKDKISHQDEMSKSYEMRGNRVQPEPQTNKHYGNERTIFWTPEMTFTRKHANAFPGRNPEVNSGGMSPSMKLKGSPRVSATDQKADNKASISFQRHTTTEKDAAKTSGAFSEVEPPRRRGPGDDPFAKLFQRPILVKPTAPTYSKNTPQGFRQKISPDRIQPYEVEEIIEEKFQVDVDDNDDEGSFKAFTGTNVILNNPKKKTEDIQKGERFQSIIDDSVNTILKGLISPALKTPPSPDKSVERPTISSEKTTPSGDNSSPASNASKIFTNHSFLKKANENIIGSSWNLPQTSKPKRIQPTPKPTERHHGWYHKSAEAAQNLARKLFKPDSRVDSSRGFDLSPFEYDYLSFLPTGSPRTPSAKKPYEQPFAAVFDIEEFGSDLAEDEAEESTLEPPSAGTLKSFDLLRNILAGHQPKKSRYFTTQAVENPTAWPTQSFLPVEASSSAKEFPDTESAAADAPVTPEVFQQTVRYFSDDMSGEEKTERSPLELSDQPLVFDLLTTTLKLDSKKDQEVIWKNSRRMHFGHEPLETTIRDGISHADETSQRRSDILITDNLADYADDEMASTLSYLEKLKQNYSLLPPGARNFSSDELIPFIPLIINDLREGRIPSEDISILSGALGKYWKPILTLSHFSNLDVLPLVNVKDEKDLENVLRNYLPEEETSTPAGTTEGDYRTDDYDSQSYDYMDEYKDLYKDILGQELGDKSKRYRPKRDAEDDLKTLEATREYFESIEEEHNEDVGNDYVFEDLMYDEGEEDSSVFELMEVSDVHIKKEQTR